MSYQLYGLCYLASDMNGFINLHTHGWKIITLLFCCYPIFLCAQTDPAYVAAIDAWHRQRTESLKSENGWLNLAGLFWLEEGRNSFGSDKDNQLVFPKGTVPAYAGFFTRNGYRVTLETENAVPVRINEKEVHEGLVYDSSWRTSPLISYGNLRWTIIRRGDKIGVRLRDLGHPSLKSFHGIERFPVDASWKLEAILKTDSIRKTIAIRNVLGQTTEQYSPGRLQFTIQGKLYSLDALEEEDQLFIIFGDQTNGESTYPSGRFVYVAKPGPDGRTVIDFNKSYNPPCAFTPHATCPLPPRQNHLPLPIPAGEKNFHLDEDLD